MDPVKDALQASHDRSDRSNGTVKAATSSRCGWRTPHARRCCRRVSPVSYGHACHEVSLLSVCDGVGGGRDSLDLLKAAKRYPDASPSARPSCRAWT